jgi:hypothetical protein
MAALSYYDAQPLNATLEQLVDFDLINKGLVRLSPRCKSAPITYWRAARCRRGFGEELRGSLHRVLEKLPQALLSDPDVARLRAESTGPRGIDRRTPWVSHLSSHLSEFEYRSQHCYRSNAVVRVQSVIRRFAPG